MERTWRALLEMAADYVQPVAYPLRVIPHLRGRNEYNRACFKLDSTPLPEVPCVYVMRYKADQLLRIGTAEKGLRDRVLRGYNRPYPAGHPSTTVNHIYYEYGTWAGGAHLTNARVLHCAYDDLRRADLEVEVHPFRKDLLSWERRMLELYVQVFGVRPALNRGTN